MDNVCLSCRGDPCLCRCWPCAAKEDEIKRLQRRNAYLEKHVGGTVKGKAQETIEDQAAEIERLRALLLRWRDAARALEADTERALRVVKEVR